MAPYSNGESRYQNVKFSLRARPCTLLFAPGLQSRCLYGNVYMSANSNIYDTSVTFDVINASKISVLSVPRIDNYKNCHQMPKYCAVGWPNYLHTMAPYTMLWDWRHHDGISKFLRAKGPPHSYPPIITFAPGPQTQCFCNVIYNTFATFDFTAETKIFLLSMLETDNSIEF